ncbi:hypothetical protein [Nitrosomonas sp.]|uniref:hypothetical protein n=1 Tax=Nitrosomonas sp. TaxID=42353 RepID=UPI0033058210
MIQVEYGLIPELRILQIRIPVASYASPLLLFNQADKLADKTEYVADPPADTQQWNNR